MDRSSLIAGAGRAGRVLAITKGGEACLCFDTSCAWIAFTRREMTGIGWIQRRTM